MACKVAIQGGFAEVEAGSWLMSRGQPAAFSGKAVRRRRTGWIVPDRARLELVETTGESKCASATRPFLTHIPCAAPVHAVSEKVLVAPAAARAGAKNVKVVPFSLSTALCATEFREEWLVAATVSRTARANVEDGATLSVRPDAVVAWTGGLPTGFCPKLGLWDMLLPRGPRDLLLNFHGPAVVWIEGSSQRSCRNVAGKRRAC